MSHVESVMLFPEINLDALSLGVQVIKLLTVVANVRPVVHTLLLGIFQVAVVSAPGLHVVQTKSLHKMEDVIHALHAL